MKGATKDDLEYLVDQINREFNTTEDNKFVLNYVQGKPQFERRVKGGRTTIFLRCPKSQMLDLLKAYSRGRTDT